MSLSPVLPYKVPKYNQLIFCKTNIGGWFFDAFIRLDHTSRLRITEHPVQTGASVTDHSFLEPKELVVEVKMSDTAKSLVSGQFMKGTSSRSVLAYDVLKQLQALRVPIQVVTRLGIYKNMLIEVLAAPDDYKNLYGLNCTVSFKEIIVAQVKTVKMSARPQKTDNTNKGNPEPVKPNQSILKQITGLLNL